jgi:predicted deacetylase
MIPSPAQYLLRFDDLCPALRRERWERFPPLLAEFGIRPILATIPENCDPDMAVGSADAEFWDKMRAMQTAGATIGLHGYRHLCLSRGRSLVPLHRATEFAGVAEEIQRRWIRAGLEILRARGLNPTIWVAPRHGFDRATLRVLRGEGISLLSDGFAHRAFLRNGMTWIPQQLWAPEVKSSGLWTICLHANTAPDSAVERLREFLRGHAAQFTSVERVVTEFKPTSLGPWERLRGGAAILRIRSRKRLKRLLGRA